MNITSTMTMYYMSKSRKAHLSPGTQLASRGGRPQVAAALLASGAQHLKGEQSHNNCATFK